MTRTWDDNWTEWTSDIDRSLAALTACHIHTLKTIHGTRILKQELRIYYAPKIASICSFHIISFIHHYMQCNVTYYDVYALCRYEIEILQVHIATKESGKAYGMDKFDKPTSYRISKILWFDNLKGNEQCRIHLSAKFRCKFSFYSWICTSHSDSPFLSYNYLILRENIVTTILLWPIRTCHLVTMSV